jgi:hypothetical protein
MAIQVSGTTVIDGSRVLSNVTGLKTVGGTAILGSGDIAVGGSTTYGDVGTYTRLGVVQTGTRTFVAASTSYAAASLKKPTSTCDTAHNLTFVNSNIPEEASGLSGTWRTMHDIIIEDSVDQLTSVLLVRIS